MTHEMSGMLFPWERSAFGDRTEKLKWWQKAYWVGFACVAPRCRLSRALPRADCSLRRCTLLLAGV